MNNLPTWEGYSNLEITKEETEYCFDVGKRDEINDLKSNCIYISKDKARELAEWIIKGLIFR